MLVKDSSGREVEIEVYGPLDDIQCDSAVYTDDGSDVDDNEVDWILDTYADSIYEHCEEWGHV